MKAFVLDGLKNKTRAVEEIDKAIELDKYNYELASMKIFFFMELEDKDTALEFVDDYITRYPDRENDLLLFKSFLYYYMGKNAEKEMNNEQEANNYYNLGLEVTNKLLETIPDHPKALNNKILYLASLKEPELAIKTAENLVKKYPEEGNYFDTYAEVLQQFGKCKKAIEIYKKAIALEPNGFYVHLSYNRLAECYKELGDYENALEAALKSKDVASKHLPGGSTEYEYTSDNLIEEIKELLKNERRI